MVAKLSENYVTIVFGQTAAEAQAIDAGYQRFAFKNVVPVLPDLLRTFGNVVTLWHRHPSNTDLTLVVGCLK